MSDLGKARIEWTNRLESGDPYFEDLILYWTFHGEPFADHEFIDIIRELKPTWEEKVIGLASTVAKANTEGLVNRGLYFRAVIMNMRTPLSTPDSPAGMPGVVQSPRSSSGWMQPEEFGTRDPIWLCRVYKWEQGSFPSKAHAMFDMSDDQIQSACGVIWELAWDLQLPEGFDPHPMACKHCIRSMERAGFEFEPVR